MKTTKFEILEELFNKNGEFLSGEYLGNKFAISRNAVFKHIEALKNNGYNIESVNNKGHKLVSFENAYDEYVIERLLKEKGYDYNVIFNKVTESTNILAKEYLSSAKKTIVVAGMQTGGSGRKGRAFVSNEGGVYVSFVFGPKNLAINQASKIIMLSGVAVVRLLKTLSISASLKWPNDVFVNKKKICGMNSELSGNIDGYKIILGIGINVNNDFSTALNGIVTNMHSEGFKGQVLEVLVLLVSIFDALFNECEELGYEKMIEEYKSYSNTLGKEIKVINGDNCFFAKALDVDSDGFLIVERDGKKEKIISGDVSIR